MATLREEWRVDELAAKPPLVSELLVVDGAWATKSHAFWEACCHIGSDLQLARPYTPTDKAQMERFYGTINRWQQAMPAHVGRNATERGVGVERDAYYLPFEAEDLFWRFVLGIYHCTEHAGLALPEAPEHAVSPNRMYDIGVATSGMVRLPPDPDIYFEILPKQWRAVQKGSGVIHRRAGLRKRRHRGVVRSRRKPIPGQAERVAISAGPSRPFADLRESARGGLALGAVHRADGP